MMDQSPLCYIPSFVEIGPPVRERNIKVFTIYGPYICIIYGPFDHLGHVTRTNYTNFDSLFQRIPYMEFGFDWLSGFPEDVV